MRDRLARPEQERSERERRARAAGRRFERAAVLVAVCCVVAAVAIAWASALRGAFVDAALTIGGAR
jgi:hypothetical protein